MCLVNLIIINEILLIIIENGAKEVIGKITEITEIARVVNENFLASCCSLTPFRVVCHMMHSRSVINYCSIGINFHPSVVF